jgi:lipopolysaccharide/colanic/teichoic acid biosynthesis glycosyltransferase
MPLNGHTPPFLPVMGLPLICYTVQALARAGIREIVLVAGPDRANHTVRKYVPDVRVVERRETCFQGTAASLKELERGANFDRFLVIRGNLLVHEDDVRILTAQHTGESYLATAVVDDEDQPIGMYLFEREILRHIGDGYSDIEEHLIPRLKRDRMLRTFRFSGRAPIEMNRVEKLVLTERSLLGNGGRDRADGAWRHSSFRQHAANVWIGRDVRIAHTAKLTGPVVVGDESVIEDGALVIGPTVIGKGCRVGAGSIVRQSTIWDHAQIQDGAEISRSLIGFQASVASRRTIESGFVPSSPLDVETVNLLARSSNGGADIRSGLSPVIPLTDHLRAGVYAFTKRLIDIIGAVIGLLLSAPLFPLLALAIRRDSPGHVFFVQYRRGKDDKEFPMLKFRTMCVGADKMQAAMRHLNYMDGPVFKIADDPRMTKVGRFLRETSLDELPQLVNVLLGHMSLVGPRPLVADELAGCPIWRTVRLSVRPGITGLWQIHCRHSRSFSDWVGNDMAYVKNQSLRQDLWILYKTVRLILPSFLRR